MLNARLSNGGRLNAMFLKSMEHRKSISLALALLFTAKYLRNRPWSYINGSILNMLDSQSFHRKLQAEHGIDTFVIAPL